MSLPVAVVSDTFTGTNGSAWNSTIWNMAGVSAPSTATIQSNAGQMTSGPGTGYDVLANAITNNVSITDCEVLVSITPGSAAEQYGVVAVRCSGGWNGSHPNTGYLLEINFAAGTYTTFKAVGTVETTFSAISGFTVSVAMRVRLRIAGTTFQTKAWILGNAEPVAWDQTNTDSAITGPGGVVLTANDGAAGTVQTVTFDDFMVQSMSPVSTISNQAINRASVY